MKAYFYTPADVGMTEFPSGLMRLAGVEQVPPQEADVFVLPPILHNVPKERIYALPHLKGNEERHVFWNCGDDQDTWYGLPSLFIRCDATRQVVEHDPNTIGWPWPVEDLYVPFESFDFDVVFQGWASTSLTTTVIDSVARAKLTAHLEPHAFFYGYHDKAPEYAHYRSSFIDTLRRSRLSLVPRSIPGIVRYRLYEAMSAGRVPVHFCDDCVLPWPDRIDYSRCSIAIPEHQADKTGEIIKDWLSRHTDDDILEMGIYGRAMWKRWLDPRKWDELFTCAVSDHCGC